MLIRTEEIRPFYQPY